MDNLPENVPVHGTGIPGLKAKLLKREGNFCLFERSDGYFELFEVQISSPVKAFGRSYPERETYPGNEDFGRAAYCFRDKENALREFRRLTESP